MPVLLALCLSYLLPCPSHGNRAHNPRTFMPAFRVSLKRVLQSDTLFRRAQTREEMIWTGVNFVELRWNSMVHTLDQMSCMGSGLPVPGLTNENIQILKRRAAFHIGMRPVPEKGQGVCAVQQTFVPVVLNSPPESLEVWHT